MKSDYITGQSLRDNSNEIADILAVFSVVTRTEVTELVESCIAKIHEKTKKKVAETGADTFETLSSRVIRTLMRDASP